MSLRSFRETKGGQDATFSATECFKQATEVLFQAIEYTVFFRLVVQGLREIGVSYCVHKVTTAVLPSTKSMETLSSGHIMYTIGHTYIPKSLDNQPKKHSTIEL